MLPDPRSQRYLYLGLLAMLLAMLLMLLAPGHARAQNTANQLQARGSATHSQAGGHGPEIPQPSHFNLLISDTYLGGNAVDVKPGWPGARDRGHAWGHKLFFDFSKAQFVVKDTNDDGSTNLDDVAVGEPDLAAQTGAPQRTPPRA